MTPLTELTGTVGFGSPLTEKTFAKRRRDGVELVASLTLAVALVIAATAVSIGMARAQTIRAVLHQTAAMASISIRKSGP